MNRIREIKSKHIILGVDYISDLENEIERQQKYITMYESAVKEDNATKERLLGIIRRYEKALHALLQLSFDSYADDMTDIITDTLQGYELDDQYDECALEGKEAIERYKKVTNPHKEIDFGVEGDEKIWELYITHLFTVF